MKTIVYNKKTGDAVEIDGIDGREYIESGGWSAEPVKIKKTKAIKKDIVSVDKEDNADTRTV
jgi:hypothetical protein